jgi:hypothetical protein
MGAKSFVLPTTGGMRNASGFPPANKMFSKPIRAVSTVGEVVTTFAPAGGPTDDSVVGVLEAAARRMVAGNKAALSIPPNIGVRKGQNVFWLSSVPTIKLDILAHPRTSGNAICIPSCSDSVAVPHPSIGRDIYCGAGSGWYSTEAEGGLTLNLAYIDGALFTRMPPGFFGYLNFQMFSLALTCVYNILIGRRFAIVGQHDAAQACFNGAANCASRMSSVFYNTKTSGYATDGGYDTLIFLLYGNLTLVRELDLKAAAIFLVEKLRDFVPETMNSTYFDMTSLFTTVTVPASSAAITNVTWPSFALFPNEPLRAGPSFDFDGTMYAHVFGDGFIPITVSGSFSSNVEYTWEDALMTYTISSVGDRIDSTVSDTHTYSAYTSYGWTTGGSSNFPPFKIGSAHGAVTQPLHTFRSESVPTVNASVFSALPQIDFEGGAPLIGDNHDVFVSLGFLWDGSGSASSDVTDVTGSASWPQKVDVVNSSSGTVPSGTMAGNDLAIPSGGYCFTGSDTLVTCFCEPQPDDEYAAPANDPKIVLSDYDKVGETPMTATYALSTVFGGPTVTRTTTVLGVTKPTLFGLFAEFAEVTGWFYQTAAAPASMTDATAWVNERWAE